MSVTFDVTPIFDCEGPWLRRSISTAYNQFTWEKFHSVLAYRGVAQNLMEWPICDIYVPAFLYVGTRRCWCWGSNSLGHCLEWMLLSTQLNRLCYFLGVWHHVSLVLALRLGTSPWLLHFVLCLVWTIWHQWGSPRGVYPLPGLTGRVYILFQVWQEGGSWDFFTQQWKALVPSEWMCQVLFWPPGGSPWRRRDSVEVALLMARRIENISASMGVAFPAGALTETSSIDENCIF